MQYAVSMPFAGNTAKAFGLAEPALTALGYRITERSANVLECTGPKLMNNRQNPLLGASQIRITRSSAELQLEAELGGAERIGRFVTLFPPLLCLSMALVFSVLFGVAIGPGPWIYGVIGGAVVPAVIWMLIGPFIARRIRTNTCRAVDALLANMVAVGEAT